MTIRWLSLRVVNSAFTLFVTLFLRFDYRPEILERQEDNQIALEEETTEFLSVVMRSHCQGLGKM